MTIRIKINLSKVFSDYRKYAYITLDSTWATVKHLEEHIAKLFGIKSLIYLTTDDGILIPALEKIGIISYEDQITVHLMENHEIDDPILDLIQPTKPNNTTESEETKQKRKRKRKRKNKQALDEIHKEIADENGYDDEEVDAVEKHSSKIVKKDSAKHQDDEIEEPAEPIPVIKVIPKQSIVSSLPQIVYGF